VLHVSKITPQIQKSILDGITKALVAHDSIRIHGVGMYKKADYIKIAKNK